MYILINQLLNSKCFIKKKLQEFLFINAIFHNKFVLNLSVEIF